MITGFMRDIKKQKNKTEKGFRVASPDQRQPQLKLLFLFFSSPRKKTCSSLTLFNHSPPFFFLK